MKLLYLRYFIWRAWKTYDKRKTIKNKLVWRQLGWISQVVVRSSASLLRVSVLNSQLLSSGVGWMHGLIDRILYCLTLMVTEGLTNTLTHSHQDTWHNKTQWINKYIKKNYSITLKLLKSVCWKVQCISSNCSRLVTADGMIDFFFCRYFSGPVGFGTFFLMASKWNDWWKGWEGSSVMRVAFLITERLHRSDRGGV